VAVGTGVAVGPIAIFKGPKLQEDITKDRKINKLITLTLFLFITPPFEVCTRFGLKLSMYNCWGCRILSSSLTW